MSVKFDSGWRDRELGEWLNHHGFDEPCPGMRGLFIEYHRGDPVGLVNYVRRGATLPRGPEVLSAYQSVSRVCGPWGSLPFVTCVYDPRDWSSKLFPHNESAKALLGADGWKLGSEADFATLLYGMRGRPRPDLTMYGVVFSGAAWVEGKRDPAPSHTDRALSQRRRLFEPVNDPATGRRPSPELLLPCMDVDQLVTSASGRVSLVVDYKRRNAAVDFRHPTCRAMSQLWSGVREVPAVAARYFPGDAGWSFSVHATNQAAADLLDEAWTPDDESGWREADEAAWLSLLDRCRG